MANLLPDVILLNPFSAEPSVVNCLCGLQGVNGVYSCTNYGNISPAIPGLHFLKIPKSNYLFWENYTISTLIVTKNLKFPRNSWKYQGVWGLMN